MNDTGRGILLGAILGVLVVLAATAIGMKWGAQTVQTASLPIEAPILFQPK